MKVFRPNIRLLVVLGILLLIITIGQSYLEYRSSRAAVLNLFGNQAKALITSVAKAGEKGLIAYHSLQRQIKERIYAIAGSIDILYQKGQLNKDELENIIESNNLSDLIIFDSDANPIKKFTTDLKTSIDLSSSQLLLSPIFEEGISKIDIGFVNGMEDGQQIFAVAVKNQTGGAILIGIDAAELILLNRTFGAGSAIEDISRSTNVRYAAILNNGLILAASKYFPVDKFELWHNKDNQDTVITRLVEYDNENGSTISIFEATAPFYVADQYYGDILIGIDTNYLKFLTSKLKRDIGWNAALSLVITLIAMAGIILRQNYKLLSKQYREIKIDVQRLEADKAVKAKLSAMGELAAGVAHEIRNPLNAIRIIVQRLQREFKPETDHAEYKELTDVVKKEVDKINVSIEQFLKMAKPPVLTKIKTQLNTCISDILALFESQAVKRNIIIMKNLGKLPEIEIDTKLYGQAILNLLENALVAVEENGKIEIKTHCDRKKCIIEIGDSGPGIPEELKSRVFDMYFTTKGSGTGMGLPIVLMIVKEHGGSIEILESPLGGALFKMELPVE